MESARFCVQCGRPLDVSAAGGPTVFAGFWMRVGACLIDGLVLGAANMVLFMIFGLGTIGMAIGSADRPEVAAGLMAKIALIWIAGSILIPWFYCAYFESSARQATPGKIALRLKVTDRQGARISFARATGRYFAEWITGFTFGIGYLMVAFTEKRQALHDKIADTVVVDVDTAPARIAGAPAAARMSGWAIAGLVLIVSLWPLGILAAIAIPAYHQYTVRSQVSEGLRIAADFKTAVESHFKSTGHWPADVEVLENRHRLTRLVTGSHYVDDIEVWNGTIVIAYGRDANPRIRDYLLSLRPYETRGGKVAWQCGNAEPPRSALPAGDGAEGGDADGDGDAPALGVTSLTDVNLPASCRTGFVPG